MVSMDGYKAFISYLQPESHRLSSHKARFGFHDISTKYGYGTRKLLRESHILEKEGQR